MVDTKLQSLVERLEKAVERAEANAAGGGGGAPAGGSVGAVPKLVREYIAAMEPKIAASKAAAATLGNSYITNATNDFCEILVQQAVWMVAKGKFTKPSEGDLKALMRLMSEKAAEAARVKDREMKSPPNMMQAIADSFYLFQWVVCLNDNVLVDQIKEYYDMIPHFANKVIMKKR